MTPPVDGIRPVGWVESSIRSLGDAPLQADEGAPPASLVFHDWAAPALEGLAAGDEILVLTWLHLADRGVLSVHPRGDQLRAVRGVFATRSPDRPNPVGLHRTEILRVEGARVEVCELEAVDGTPILDVKVVLGSSEGR